MKEIIGCDCIVEIGSNQSVMFPWADNILVKPKHLCNFLQEGDSIYKPANSDSLFIYRKSKKYHFILERRIWR